MSKNVAIRLSVEDTTALHRKIIKLVETANESSVAARNDARVLYDLVGDYRTSFEGLLNVVAEVVTGVKERQVVDIGALEHSMIIAKGAIEELDKRLDVYSTQPYATVPHVDDPDPSLVNALESAFAASDDDLPKFIDKKI